MALPSSRGAAQRDSDGEPANDCYLLAIAEGILRSRRLACKPKGIQIVLMPWPLAGTAIDKKMSPRVSGEFVSFQIRAVPMVDAFGAASATPAIPGQSWDNCQYLAYTRRGRSPGARPIAELFFPWRSRTAASPPAPPSQSATREWQVQRGAQGGVNPPSPFNARFDAE